MNIQQALRKYTFSSRISPLEAEVLLSFIIKKPKEYLFAHPKRELTKIQQFKTKKMMTRRNAGEPIAYLINSKEFYGLDFYVNQNVLIPRPETEILVENTLSCIQSARYEKGNLNIIDIGTGSGNIIVSIVKNIPDKVCRKFSFYGIDISKKALRVAKKNSKKHHTDKKIKFIHSDLLDYFLDRKNKIRNKHLIITANLPYVSRKIYAKYIPNLKFEPKAALVSDDNGLKHYKKLLKQIKELMRTYNCSLITVLLEISPEQKKPVLRLIGENFPSSAVIFEKDLAGKNRIAKILFKRIL